MTQGELCVQDIWDSTLLLKVGTEQFVNILVVSKSDIQSLGEDSDAVLQGHL